jgi:hypothetical protein
MFIFSAMMKYLPSTLTKPLNHCYSVRNITAEILCTVIVGGHERCRKSHVDPSDVAHYFQRYASELHSSH